MHITLHNEALSQPQKPCAYTPLLLMLLLVAIRSWPVNQHTAGWMGNGTDRIGDKCPGMFGVGAEVNEKCAFHDRIASGRL
ncbi:unnamed protein product [Nippostrongylus brasiliensis]|uniref:Secreted protein n=1 Tax=Nippostrongylus brasiliensis TaxID=27835 RepID=A0A0N4YQQ0_NIPBR|nr:unnamed protein product [Nippostrongylus brasiliensis]